MARRYSNTRLAREAEECEMVALAVVPAVPEPRRWRMQRRYYGRIIVVAILFAIVVIISVAVIASEKNTAASVKSPHEPLAVACHFFKMPNSTNCKHMWRFRGKTTGGTIPTEIGLLTKLTYLYLESHQLNGTIPSTLGTLIRLHHLELNNNQLTGTIPSTLGNLVQLSTLHLYNNQLNGTIPSTLGNLVKLSWLTLFDNQLSGTIPSTLGNLTQLRHLWLNNNTQLTGTVPSTWCSKPNGFLLGKVDCAHVECACCHCPSTSDQNELIFHST